MFSAAFVRQAIAWLNEDPDLPLAAVGWSGDFGIVIRRAPEPLVVMLRAPMGGRFLDPEFVSEATLAEADVAYQAIGDEDTFHALIVGALDPILAIVQKRLLVRGNLQPVVARLAHKGLAERWLTRLREAVEE